MMRAAVAQLHIRTHGGKEPAFCLDIPHLGNVLEDDFVFSENGRGHAGQRRVLGARHANGAHQGIAAANYKFIHAS